MHLLDLILNDSSMKKKKKFCSFLMNIVTLVGLLKKISLIKGIVHFKMKIMSFTRHSIGTDSFYDHFMNFLKLQSVSCIDINGGKKALRFHPNVLICFRR